MAEVNAGQTASLLQELGSSLNWEKSDLTPRREFTYLGLQWNTRDLTVSLPREKTDEIGALAGRLLSRPRAMARQLLTFLGKPAFAAYAVPLARLHTRELQGALRSVYKHPRDMTD